jgi:predicted TPR repeat methyltransferase
MIASQFQSSGDLIADRRIEWARDSIAHHDFTAAAELLVQALERVPDYASGWFMLGETLVRLDDRAAAIAAFARARAADPQDRHGATLHLIRLGATPAGAMPPAYVRALFDVYASRFDQALTENLHYRGPDILLDAVRRTRGLERAGGCFSSMLDLGCGTGLGGAVFRPFADRIVGVDLSAAMLAQARAKGIYERLAQGDAVAFLRDEVAAGERYDLILVADVLIYFDDLAPLARAVAQGLTDTGTFAFTVETHDGEGVMLRDTLRYAHSRDTVRAALAEAGLTLLLLEDAAPRTEKGVPVAGLVCVATNAR